jgi:hypothetical protein
VGTPLRRDLQRPRSDAKSEACTLLGDMARISLMNLFILVSGYRRALPGAIF